MKKLDGLIKCISPSFRYQQLISNRLLLFPLFWNSAGSKSVGKKYNWKNVELSQQTWKSYMKFVWLWKKTYPEKSDRRRYFLAAWSLFFFSSENDLNYDVAEKLRPYGGLIGLDDSSLDE